jgi:4-amino-4-deoxy-L-arabinose transferase-like glycosyltransferase
VSTRRRTAVAVILIAVLALAVRLAFALAFARTPLGDSIYLDSKTYDDLAVALLAGTGAALEPFFVEPLYGYLLAAVYGAFGRGLWAVRLLQALGGALVAVLCFDLGRRLYSRRAGWAAGLAAALYGPFVFYDAMLLKTSAEVLMAALLLWLLVRAVQGSGREPSWPAAGLLLGLAALLKANFLVLVPVALAAPWLVVGTSLRRAVGRAAWVAGGIALATLPIVVRNSVLAGEPTFLTTGAGMNLYQGNREGTDGGLDIPEFIQLDPAREQEDSLAEARRRAGDPSLTPGEASRFWLGESLRFIRERPGAWLRLMGRKTLLFWNRYEAADNLSFHYTRAVVPWLWLAPLGFWLVAPLGLAGTLTGAGGGRSEWLLRASVALLMLGTVLFHVADRYRLAAVPALLVLGVGFVRRGVLDWRGGRRRRVLARAAVTGAAALLVAVPDLYPGGQDMAPFDRIMALGYAERGDGARAALYGERAARAYSRQGLAMLERGEPYRAEIYFLNALDVRPDRADAWYHLGVAQEGLGRGAAAARAYERAIGDEAFAVAALTRLGRLHLAAGRLEEAEARLLAARERAPRDLHVLAGLGDLRALQGRFAEALALFETALEVDPGANWIARRVEAARARLATGTERGEP